MPMLQVLAHVEHGQHLVHAAQTVGKPEREHAQLQAPELLVRLKRHKNVLMAM